VIWAQLDGLFDKLCKRPEWFGLVCPGGAESTENCNIPALNSLAPIGNGLCSESSDRFPDETQGMGTSEQEQKFSRKVVLDIKKQL